MPRTIAIYAIIIFFLLALQISLVNGLPAGFNNLDLILVLSVYALGLSKRAFAWCLALGAGFFLDFMLFSPFGLYTFGLIFTVAAINFLHINFLTNQSLYTYVALTAGATIIFRTWSYAFYALHSFFMNVESYLELNKVFWLNQFLAVFLNIFLAALVFYLLTYASKRLTPVFLMPKKK